MSPASHSCIAILQRPVLSSVTVHGRPHEVPAASVSARIPVYSSQMIEVVLFSYPREEQACFFNMQVCSWMLAVLVPFGYAFVCAGVCVCSNQSIGVH